MTNRLDLSEAEILETYKNRWYIELFFKWIKQHLKVSHLFSHSPAGIWNQLFITLITFALIEIMRLIHQPKKSVWAFLRVVRLYIFNPISQLLTTCKRRLKKSKGRQRLPDSKPIEIRFGEDFAIVSPITKEHFLRKTLLYKKRKQFVIYGRVSFFCFIGGIIYLFLLFMNTMQR
ncbi:transposase [Sporosarcina sp. FSL K6-6792]|uniref:transposase n=1 Tax=Sporosarcina sp. FSL K6-6792 TaxID=2921559 RepID=UPI0040468AF0